MKRMLSFLLLNALLMTIATGCGGTTAAPAPPPASKEVDTGKKGTKMVIDKMD